MTTYTAYSPETGKLIAREERSRRFTHCVAIPPSAHRPCYSVMSLHGSEKLAHKAGKVHDRYVVLPLNTEPNGVIPAVYGTTESGKWGVVREARKIEAEATETTESTEAETTESTESTEAAETTRYDNIVTVMNDLFNAGKYLDLAKVDDHSDLPYVSHPSTGDAIYVTSDADTTTFYRRTVDGAVTRYTFAN